MPETTLTPRFIGAGLYKAARAEALDAVEFCLRMISIDGASVPPTQRDWKIGHSFSWHYVRIVEYRVAQLSDELEQINMARTKSKKNAQNFSSEYSFVRCELRAEDKKSAKIWIEENTADFGSLLHDAVASGYKFSCSFSSEHDTFTACLTGKPEDSINPYKTLTARHKDWLVAALTLLYKANVMFRGGVWEAEDGDDDDSWA